METSNIISVDFVNRAIVEPEALRSATTKASDARRALYGKAVSLCREKQTASLFELRLTPDRKVADDLVPSDISIRRWAYSYENVDKPDEGYNKSEPLVLKTPDGKLISHGVALCDGILGLLFYERGVQEAIGFLDVLAAITRHGMVFNLPHDMLHMQRFDFEMRRLFNTHSVVYLSENKKSRRGVVIRAVGIRE